MSRPRTRNGKFIARDALPGKYGCEPPAEPFLLYGVLWTPEDARWDDGCPIGLAWAMEFVAAKTAAKPAEQPAEVSA